MHRQVWECRLGSKAQVPVSRAFPVWVDGQTAVVGVGGYRRSRFIPDKWRSRTSYPSLDPSAKATSWGGSWMGWLQNGTPAVRTVLS